MIALADLPVVSPEPHRVDCGECNGWGVVAVGESRGSWDHPPEPIEEPCEVCQGAGQLASEECDCSVCLEYWEATHRHYYPNGCADTECPYGCNNGVCEACEHGKCSGCLVCEGCL